MVQIIWSPDAIEYMKDIRQFISKDSIFQAKRICNIIRQSVTKLRKHPEFGARLPESEDISLRELSVFDYRIIYRWTEKTKTIRILAIIHGARQLDEKFFEGL